jgi:hypothetical protein
MKMRGGSREMKTLREEGREMGEEAEKWKRMEGDERGREQERKEKKRNAQPVCETVSECPGRVTHFAMRADVGGGGGSQ